MSNTAVGSIYEKIINETISASKVDFAEDGVHESVLNDLLEKWQNRLSSNKVAQFPWDPPPPPPQANPPTAASNSASTPTYQTPTAASPPQIPASAPVSATTSAPPIKQESVYDTNNTFVPQLPQNNGYPNSALNQQQLAQQRAAALMDARFGSQAGASIAAMQAAGMSRPGQQRPTGLQMPGQPTQPQQPGQQPSSQPQQQSSIPLAQTDGAGDAGDEWQAVLANRNAQGDDGPTGKHAVDGYVRQQVQEMALRLEGGGMLETLEERERRFGKRRRVIPAAGPSIAPGDPKQPSRYDGGDESDEEKPSQDDIDEDAINSDLDDPEEAAEGEVDFDSELGDYILCTYHKVQRVKNKWKCTLEDGVLHAGGKDYVFHKAQGEFEW